MLTIWIFGAQTQECWVLIWNATMCANTVQCACAYHFSLLWNVLNHMEKSLWYWRICVGCLFVLSFICCWQISNDFVEKAHLETTHFMIYDSFRKSSFLSCDIKLNHTFSLCMYVTWMLSCQANFYAIHKSLDIIIIPLQYCYLVRVEHATRFLS